MAFHCVIVTPEAQVLDRTVTQAILPAHDGQIGILEGRAPLLVKLGVGELALDTTDAGRVRLFLEGGVAQMKGEKLTILTNEAVTPEQIDPTETRAELAEAEAARIGDDASFADRDRRMRRARAKLAMLQ